MKKNIVKASFIVAICTLSLSAMESEQKRLLTESSSMSGYGSLTKNIFNNVHQQQQALTHSIEQQEFSDISSFSLKNMYNKFCAMSDKNKRAVIKAMPTQLLFLSCVAICLPPELVGSICLSMMHGRIPVDLDKVEIIRLKMKINEATKQFYIAPIVEALNLYNSIRVALADDTLPIGPLYAGSEAERNTVLQLKSQPYPLDEDFAQVELLSKGTKATYLHDQKIYFLPDSLNLFQWHSYCLGAVGCGSGTFVCTSLMLAVIGTCTVYGPALACHTTAMSINGVVSGGCCVAPLLTMAVMAASDLCDGPLSEKINP